MSKASNKEKAQKLAAWLKEHSPVRTHFMCPIGCGIPVAVSSNGRALFDHFARCPGPRKHHVTR